MNRDKPTSWTIRLSIAGALLSLLIVLYPLAYGPWLWIRGTWFRGASGSVNFGHPIWKPLYLFEEHICDLPQPWWHDYQVWWIQQSMPPAMNIRRGGS